MIFQRIIGISDTVTLELFSSLSGTPVYAKWKDRCLYPGTITSKAGQRYVVRFEYGGSLKVKQEDVVVCNLLPVGYNVMAENEEEDYVPAMITGTRSDGYEVELLHEKKRLR